MTKTALLWAARQAAIKYGLDPNLICALCEQESNWNPWAIRYEKAFYEKYIAPIRDSMGLTEAHARATSWGLMQVMGQVARECMFGGPFLSALCDPAIGLDIGCRKFSALLAEVGTVDVALLRWNGGGDPNYPTAVKARMKNYGG